MHCPWLDESSLARVNSTSGYKTCRYINNLEYAIILNCKF